MRIKITARPEKKTAFIPLQYNEYLQGFIYHLLKERLPEVHDVGFKNGHLTFRHFTFSRIFSKDMQRQGKRIRITDQLCFFVSFLLDDMPRVMLEELLNHQSLSIGKERFDIVGIQVYENPVPEEDTQVQMDFHTMSPIVNYKTVVDTTGKKKTVYYSPFDEEFLTLTKANLVKKLNTMNADQPIERDTLKYHVVPINVDPDRSKSVVIYKGFVIEGYTGMFRFKGSSRLASIAYDTGIGSKNSQGFGMILVKKLMVL